MRIPRTLRTIVALLIVGVMFSLAGCASQQQRRTKSKPAPKKEAPAKTERKPTTGRVVSDPGWNVRELAVPTGDEATSAVLLVKRAPAEVNLGAPFEYTLTARNLTSHNLEGVVVSDLLPQGMTIVSSDPAAQGNADGKATWGLGDIPAGQSRTVRVRATAGGTGVFKHCATVSYNQLACVETRVVEPSLELTKTMPGARLTCDPIPVTLTVRNNGTGTARNVVVTDTLPDGLVTADGKRTVTYRIDALGAGQSQQATFEARAASASNTGSFENTATATADGGLEASSSASITLSRPVLTMDMSGPEMAFVGRRCTYDIVVKNTGDGEAREAGVEVALPANAVFVSASNGGVRDGNRVVWNLGTMAPGSERSAKIVLDKDRIGNVRLSGRARAYCADAASANAATEVKGIPAILLEVIDVEDPIPVGDNVEYVIRVTNQGSANGTNIVIACELEDSMQFVSATGQTRHSASGSSVNFAPVARLAPKAVAEFRLTIKAAKAGDVRFKVSMTSDQISRPVEETEATNFYE